jgi:hypothetical protein
MYYSIWIFVIFTVLVGQAARLWKHKYFSVYQELMILIEDGYHIWLRQPAYAATFTCVWMRNRTWDSFIFMRKHTPAKVIYWYHTTRTVGWKYISCGFEYEGKR